MARITIFLSLLLLMAVPFCSAELSVDEISLLDGHQIRIEDEQPFVCQDHPYTVHLFSKNPLVVYISGFITAEERTHLSNIE